MSVKSERQVMREKKEKAREKIASMLRHARESRGLTAKEAISGISIPVSRYHDMEKAKPYAADPDVMKALAANLGLNEKKLLALVDPLLRRPPAGRRRAPVTPWPLIIEKAGSLYGLMRARALWGSADMKSFHGRILRLDYPTSTLARAAAQNVNEIRIASGASRVVITVCGQPVSKEDVKAAARGGDKAHLALLRQHGPAHGFGGLEVQL